MSLIPLLWAARGVRSVLSKQRTYIPMINHIKFIKFDKISRQEFPSHMDQRNECYRRPISPHVTIYKFELHMIGSLLHRTTGIIASIYFLGFGIGTLLLPQDFQCYIDYIQAMDLPQWILVLGKSCFILPFAIHAMGGIRHLIWDLGIMLKPMSSIWTLVTITSALGIGLSLALALM